MTPLEHFNQAKLEEAIAEASSLLRANPRDLQTRGLLATLQCFAGDLDRADKQLETILSLDPEYAVGVNVIRQLLRAETARRDFFTQGNIPEFLETPSEEISLRIKASISFREGDLSRAQQELEEADRLRPVVTAAASGGPAGELRDLDDLLASVFEICTVNGKYLWVPMNLVEHVEFAERSGLADFFWAPLTVSFKAGRDLQGYMPLLYIGTERAQDPNVRIGRATDWQGGNQTPARGLGQRMFLIGDDAVPMTSLKTLALHG